MLHASGHLFDLSLHLASVCVSPSQYFEQAVTVFAHSEMRSWFFLSGLALHQGFFSPQTYGVTMWKGKTIAFFLAPLAPLEQVCCEYGFLPLLFSPFFFFLLLAPAQGTDPSKC